MIRLILLGVAVAAGGVLLKTTYDNPGPLTVDRAVHALRPGTQAAVRALDSAGDLAGTVSRAADTGWAATKGAAERLGDAVDAGSKLMGDSTQQLGEFLPQRGVAPASRTTARGAAALNAAPRVPASPDIYRAPQSRASAMDVLPLEQAVPVAEGAASHGDR